MDVEGIGTIVEQRGTGAFFVEAPDGYYRVENECDASGAVGSKVCFTRKLGTCSARVSQPPRTAPQE